MIPLKKNKVEKWATNSKESDEYVSEDGRMHIFNYGKLIN